MNALVIGGTSGFGKEISDILFEKGYNLITISRSVSGYTQCPHYYCDVGDENKWFETLQKIKTTHISLDFLACIVGYAKAKSSKNLKLEDWDQAFSKNVTYVAFALQELRDLLIETNSPKAITIGSQWSYKIGCDELVPYTVSKHALRTMTEDFSQRNPQIKINHYCVPTMDTPGYWMVKESFRNTGQELTINKFTPNGLADPKIVAKSIINHIIYTNLTGQTFVIKPNGEIEELK